MGDFLCSYSIVAVLSGLVGSALATRREASHWGFLLGLVFGPFGLFAALLVDGRARCPACCESVGKNAVLCPQCRTALVWNYQGRPWRPTIHPASPLAKQLREQGVDPVTLGKINPALLSKQTITDIAIPERSTDHAAALEEFFLASS